MDASPIVAIVAGPNGAGKSTLAPLLLRDTLGLVDYVNADVVALGLSGFDPGAVGLAAGRIVLRHLDELAQARRSFAFETTLSTRSFAPWLTGLRASGYRVVLFFLWLPTPELALERVAARVRLGGHDVPSETVRRRHARGLANFFGLYRERADWRFYDTSGPTPRLVAAGVGSVTHATHDASLWRRLEGLHGSP